MTAAVPRTREFCHPGATSGACLMSNVATIVLSWILRALLIKLGCRRSADTRIASFSLSAATCIEVSRCQSTRVEQTAIASILGALDDKIDLNRRMNETLEAMARAIFKDWFVDFGPTRAKMEGRAPYLAPEIWALFPDRLDDEGKPEGWR